MRAPRLALAFGVFLLFGVSAPAHASPFTVQYSDTIVGGLMDLASIGLASGQSAVITVVLDNGGTDNLSEIWTAADLESVTFNFNNGGLVTTFVAPFDGGNFASGSFTTNAAGTLTSVLSQLFDSQVDADFTTTGGAATFSYFLDTSDAIVYVQGTGGAAVAVGLANITGIETPANWQFVETAPIPEPATLSLLGLGLGAAAVRRRMKRR